MNAFWTLVRNDIGFNISGIRRKHKNIWIYAAIAVMIWLFQYAITLTGSSRFSIDPRYALFAVVPMFFIVSGSPASREWRGDTAGWWLSLPCPRSRLLLAKAVASFIRKLEYLLIIAGVLLMLFLGSLAMRPDLVTAAIAGSYATQCLQLLALALIFSPVAVAAGLLFRLIALSKWKVLSPLIWFGVFGGFCYLVSLFVGGGQYDVTLMDTLCRIWISGVGNLLFFLAAEACATAALTLFSVYLLKWQIEL